MAKKIYVGNLGYSVTNNEIQQLFRQYGTVTSASIVADRHTGESKGFAFVEMTSDAEVKAAIEGLNGQQFSGRALNVNEARPKVPAAGGGGGFGGSAGRGADRRGGGGGGGRW